jgi:hypothetical protein
MITQKGPSGVVILNEAARAMSNESAQCVDATGLGPGAQTEVSTTSAISTDRARSDWR